MTTLLTADHTSFSYTGADRAVNDLSLIVEGGQRVALIGPNGSGKSTFFRLVTGSLHPQEGSITLGTDHIGLIPQHPALYPHLTVRENVRAIGHMKTGKPPSQETAETAIVRGNLADHVDKRVSELSGGLKQRLNVAVGLMDNPDLVILDEPTTGVDLEHAATIWSMLDEHVASGAGIMFATHQPTEMVRADAVTIISEGHTLFAGSWPELADRLAGSPDAPLEDVTGALIEFWQPREASQA